MMKPCRYCGSDNTYCVEEGILNHRYHYRDCGKEFEASTGLKEGLGIAASVIGIIAGIDGVYQHHHHDNS